MKSKYTLYDSKELRKKYLATKLALLGFENVEDLKFAFESNKGYCVLGKIGSSLENYFNPKRVIRKGTEETDLIIDSLVQEIEDNQIFMEQQDELFECFRGIYPDFGLSMKEKVSEEDWKLYSKVVRKTGMLIRDLTIGSKKRDFTKKRVTEMNEQDAISRVIDSEEFAKACRIEDEFIIKECERFKEEAERFGNGDERVKESTAYATLLQRVRESEALASKKQKYVDRYEKYSKFLESITDTITINTANPHKKGVGKDRE